MSQHPPPPTPPPWSVPRKHPRARLLTEVETSAGGATTLGKTRNISEGGLCLLSPQTLALQTEVFVRFKLPPSHPIATKALVVRSLPGVEMGIVFLDLPSDDRHAIAAFVQQSAP